MFRHIKYIVVEIYIGDGKHFMYMAMQKDINNIHHHNNERKEAINTEWTRKNATKRKSKWDR